jgi:nicotinate phosphoribosyltransferase
VRQPRPDPLVLCEDDLGLVTDLYQLTMFAAYREHRPGMRGCFELWFRELPPARNFLVAAGLEAVLAFLARVHFSEERIDSLRTLPALCELGGEFFRALAELRFEGDVWGVREGTVVFADEPVLRVEAPIEQAQLVETYILSAVSYATLVASKAARVRIAAGDRRLIDFGSRRAHGPQAACWAARAAYLAGFDGSSNVWVASRLGVPSAGTMAHSFVLSFAREEDAFHAYSRTFPTRTVLLVDTFDTLSAVARAAADPELRFVAIRLDSGDLVELSRRCRRILDDHGRTEVEIVASGDLDEYRVAEMVAVAAPVASFGVGTRMVTSADAPSLQAVYKLVAVEESGGATRDVAKRSVGKRTLPGAKQVWRRRDGEGVFAEDVVCHIGMRPRAGAWEPLLEPWMREGRLEREVPTVAESRSYALRQLDALPLPLRELGVAAAYPVSVVAGEYAEET